MEGEVTPITAPEHTQVAKVSHPPTRAKQLRWFIVVGLLLALVLGILYGFNTFRSKAIATFFANNKPPPTQISAVTATSEEVPHFGAGIGSLAAAHQVTIMPEVGGRVTEIAFDSGAKVNAVDKIIQINDAPDQGDLANYHAQWRWAQVTLQPPPPFSSP